MANKSKGSSSSKTKKARISSTRTKREQSSIPPGFRSVTPYLAINGATQAIEFYKAAFGAKELDRSPTPDGRILNAQIKIGDSIVMLSDEFPGAQSRAPTSVGTSTVTLHIYSKDVDRFWEQAVAAGAKVAMPLDNQFWGERYGQLEDPFGHRWSVSMRVKMSPDEMKRKREAVMAMFDKGQHPGYEVASTPGTQ